MPFLLLLVILVVAPTTLEARQPPQTTEVTGAVIDARTGDRIEGAVVRFPGADRYTLTGDDGFFTIRNVEAGEHEVFVHRIGYRERGFRIFVRVI